MDWRKLFWKCRRFWLKHILGKELINGPWLINNYTLTQTRENLDALHKTMVQSMESQRGLIDENMLFAISTHSFLVKGLQEYGEKEYDAWFQSLATQNRRMATSILESAGTGSAKPASRTARKDRLVLAFLTFSDSPTDDHITPLMNYLGRHHADSVDVHYVALGSAKDPVPANLDTRRVTVTHAPFDGNRVRETTLALRTELQQLSVDVAVWIHIPLMAVFLYGLELAPYQIFFSQYLHPDLTTYGYAGVMTYGAPTNPEQRFFGNSWRVIPSAIEWKQPTVDAEEVGRLRATYAPHGEILFATLARVHKVMQPDFVQAVVAILKRTHNSKFLYTSSGGIDTVRGIFAREGLEERVENIGWVDIPVYSSVIDILLDTFPVANGLTALNVMAMGKPVVSMATLLSYVGRDLVPLLDAKQVGNVHSEETWRRIVDAGADLLFDPFAYGVEDYIALAVALANDREKRQASGGFFRTCFEALYTNVPLMGETFMRHLQEIAGPWAETDTDNAVWKNRAEV